MKTDESTTACPKCGAPVPPEAPQGLCPQCVFAQAVAPEAAPTATSQIPSLERLAVAFPQLQILELIGRGGMGFVFKARQPHLDRFVALKLLPDSLAHDAHFAERFNREGRTLARLNHPNIVSIFDFGQAGGFYFLLMEYVDGVNLRQAMQAGKFSPSEALSIVPKICEALQFAHEEGILHRDIKPENILLDAKGRVKIADFGIAKIVGDDKPDVSLTATGAALGTPHYMAPEQFEKPATVDHRADIYSLGVVFYELLTGELPIGRFSPPSQRTPLDPRVDDVVMRTLEKEREKRFQSAGEMGTNVEHLTEVGAGARPSTTSPPSVAPAEDFILCHPRLPRMAHLLTVFALVAAPLLWFIGLATLDDTPHPNAYAEFVQVMMRLVTFWGELLTTALFFIGGWKLRALKKSGAVLISVALWLNMFILLLAIGGTILIEKLAPSTDSPPLSAGEALLLATQLGSLVFQIIALVWLRRNRAVLNNIFQSAAGAAGPRGTIIIGQTHLVRRPAQALFVTGIVNWVGSIFVIFLLAYTALGETWMLSPAQLAVVAGLILLSSSAIIFGALKMMKVEAYPLAIAASVLAMITTPGSIIGLPIGLWALFTLRRPDVRAAFQSSIAPQKYGALKWACLVLFLFGSGFVLMHRRAQEAASPEAVVLSKIRHAPSTHGLIELNWKCSIPPNHLVVFGFHGMSNDTPMFFPELSGFYATAPNRPHEMTVGWGIQDGKYLSPSLANQDRWDARIGGVSTSAWMPTRPVFSMTPPIGWPEVIRLRSGETNFLPLVARTSSVNVVVWVAVSVLRLPEGVAGMSAAPLGAGGNGTNWFPLPGSGLRHKVVSQNEPALPPWIRFTFTAVELREVKGVRWLAIDYLDDVHGECQKSFPWETTIPGFKAETRTTEFVTDAKDGSPAVRHQRIEYRMPDSTPRDQLERLRDNLEKALKQKSFRLELGENEVPLLLFELPGVEGGSLKARIKLVPPLKQTLKVPPTVAAPTFGPVYDILLTSISSMAHSACFDFEASQSRVPPENLLQELLTVADQSLANRGAGQPSPELREWLNDSGVDVLCVYTANRASLLLIEATPAIIQPPEPLDTMSPARLPTITDDARTNTTPGAFPVFHVFPIHLWEEHWKSAKAIPFRTREGNVGVLEFRGVTEIPKGVRIRYKMVPDPSAGGNAAVEVPILMARQQFQTIRQRVDAGVASRQELAEARRDLEVAEARGDAVMEARAKLKFAEYMLQQVATKRSKTGAISLEEVRAAQTQQAVAEIELQQALRKQPVKPTGPAPQKPDAAALQFRLVADGADKDSPVDMMVQSRERGPAEQLRVLRTVLLDGSSVARAGVDFDAKGSRVIGVELTTEGARQFGAITAANINRQLAIIAGGKVLSAPVIRTAITGELQISSDMPVTEMYGLVGALNGNPTGLQFSSPVERSLPRAHETQREPQTEAVGLDLDLGTYMTNRSFSTARRMAIFSFETNGVDLVAAGISDQPASFVALGSVLIEVPAGAWDSMPAEEVGWNWKLMRAAAKEQSRFGVVPGGSDTFMFRTHENGFGLLQFLPATNSAPDVKIRYKLVQATGAKAAKPTAREELDAARKKANAGRLTLYDLAQAERKFAVATTGGDAVAAARMNLEFAEASLSETKRRVEVGIQSPLDLKFAESRLALAENDLKEALKTNSVPAKNVQTESTSLQANIPQAKLLEYRVTCRLLDSARERELKLLSEGATDENPLMVRVREQITETDKRKKALEAKFPKLAAMPEPSKELTQAVTQVRFPAHKQLLVRTTIWNRGVAEPGPQLTIDNFPDTTSAQPVILGSRLELLFEPEPNLDNKRPEFLLNVLLQRGTEQSSGSTRATMPSVLRDEAFALMDTSPRELLLASGSSTNVWLWQFWPTLPLTNAPSEATKKILDQMVTNKASLQARQEQPRPLSEIAWGIQAELSVRNLSAKLRAVMASVEYQRAVALLESALKREQILLAEQKTDEHPQVMYVRRQIAEARERIKLMEQAP